MSVVPMYHHYDECHTLCARQKFNVMGTEVEVEYYHLNRDAPTSYSLTTLASTRSATRFTLEAPWMWRVRGALMSQAGIEAVWHVHCGGPWR